MPSAQLNTSCWITEYYTPYDAYAHGITRVLYDATTAFQHAQIVESGHFGLALVLDGKWQSCTGDEFMYHEPLVQPASVILALRGHAPRSVLILGGGEGATLREVLRWSSVERVTMVDIDGEVVEACEKHMRPMHRGAFDDPRSDVVIGDALAYIEDPANTPEGGWDLIISDLTDPIEDGPSFMLFTREYFADLERLLAPHGALVVQAGPTTPTDLTQHCRLHRTLRDVFASVRSMQSCVPTYPGPWSFLLASQREIEIPTDAEASDAAIAAHTTEATDPFGGRAMRAVDGVFLPALFTLPKELRAAIEAETMVYTREAPPAFFGAGELGDGDA